MYEGGGTQTPTQQVKPNDATGGLVDVGQVSEVPVPVAFQVEPVLSFVVRVWSLLKPPAEIDKITVDSRLINEQKNLTTDAIAPCVLKGAQDFHIKSSKQNTAGLSRPWSKSSIPNQVSEGGVQVGDKTTGLQLLKRCQ